MRLELGEGHLNGIEIGGIGRQKEEPGSFLLQALGSLGSLVDGKIVENDDIARRQCRGQLGSIQRSKEARSIALSLTQGAVSSCIAGRR